jgi:dienelactone hydrolase
MAALKLRNPIVRNLTVLLAAGSVLGLQPAARAQKIEVSPSQVLIDEAAIVRVSGTTPGSRVTIHAELTDGDGQSWSSEAEFVSDAQGTVDTSRQAPEKGSYRIVSAMGLVWSMLPVGKDIHVYRPPHDLGSQLIRFQLFENGKEQSFAQLEQIMVRPDVRRVRVDGVLHGVLFVPPEEGKHPGVLVLGGSEGGMLTSRAAWLASRGYAAFALCYFHCEGTPPNLENIPLEYFGKALAWLMERPEVDGGRVAVMGASRGGELALQLGSMYPQIRAVVAYVPANVRYPACCGGLPHAAWTWAGAPLAWAGPRQKGDSAAMFRAAIGVEHTHGPILMIGGQEDGVWPSSQMVDSVAARLRENHFAFPVAVLIYPHAGHRAGLPQIIPAWHNSMPHPISGTMMNYGGSAEGNAESSLDAIPKVLEFLRESLAISP